MNGVSWLHGKVSQRCSPIWKGYFPEEMHVGYVTNGVHFPTWTATEVKKLLLNFQRRLLKINLIANVGKLFRMYPMRKSGNSYDLEEKLIDYIRKKFSDSWLKNQGDPSRVFLDGED